MVTEALCLEGSGASCDVLLFPSWNSAYVLNKGSAFSFWTGFLLLGCFCDPMGCSLLVFSVHGILQAMLEWVAISFSRGSSWPKDRTHTSCIGKWILYHWATRKALYTGYLKWSNWSWWELISFSLAVYYGLKHGLSTGPNSDQVRGEGCSELQELSANASHFRWRLNLVQ